jgi:nucleotide-binding universal stress UspA family protein
MLVVKQEPQISYEHVLVPVDFSRYSAPALRFATELVPGATLHVFHAVDSAVEGRLRSAGASDEAVQAHRDALLREADASLAELTTDYPDRTLKVAEVGDARVLINRRAEERTCTRLFTAHVRSRHRPESDDDHCARMFAEAMNILGNGHRVRTCGHLT